MTADCGTTKITNGEVEFPTGTAFGASGTVSCDAGYNVDGPGMIQCLDTGIWSADTSCTIKGWICSVENTLYINIKYFVVVYACRPSQDQGCYLCCT